jgi:hypothetical protein
VVAGGGGGGDHTAIGRANYSPIVRFSFKLKGRRGGSWWRGGGDHTPIWRANCSPIVWYSFKLRPPTSNGITLHSPAYREREREREKFRERPSVWLGYLITAGTLLMVFYYYLLSFIMSSSTF